jgi:hypothetical protein
MTMHYGGSSLSMYTHRVFERARSSRLLAGSALLFVLACGVPACGQGGEGGSADGATSSPDDSVAADSDPIPIQEQPALKDLGPTGRRVMVMVLPGDASVEVDGIAIRRRDGVIDLLGKVGEVRRLRVLKGAQSIEKDVTIQEAGASPALIDLNARATGAGAGSAEPEAGATPSAAPTATQPGRGLFGNTFDD